MLTDERLAFYRDAPYIDPWNAYQDIKLLQAEISRLTTKADAEGARVIELEATFNMRWRADRRAIKMWHDSGGDELTMPDHADLCVWLLSQLAEARELIGMLRASTRFIDGDDNASRKEVQRKITLVNKYMALHMPEQDKEG